MSMKKVLMFAIALALLATPAAWGAVLDAQPAEAAPSRPGRSPLHTITVTGTGTAYGAPDIVRVGLVWKHPTRTFWPRWKTPMLA